MEQSSLNPREVFKCSIDLTLAFRRLSLFAVRTIETHLESNCKIPTHPSKVRGSIPQVGLMGWLGSRLPSFNCGGEKYMRYKYDVFLSFRGRDVRRGFVDHLYHALTRKGFRVFLDSRNLMKGDDISATLLHAIEVSRILIPIFSTNYAESAWCLREASLIARQTVLRRKESMGSAIAIPIFYDVTPSEVRWPEKYGSPFAQAFQEHKSSGRYSTVEVSEWKDALFQLCRLSGWTLQEDTNGYEGALVKLVVQEVAKHCKTGHRRWLSI